MLNWNPFRDDPPAKLAECTNLRELEAFLRRELRLSRAFVDRLTSTYKAVLPVRERYPSREAQTHDA